jgi:hypothetical protein
MIQRRGDYRHARCGGDLPQKEARNYVFGVQEPRTAITVCQQKAPAVEEEAPAVEEKVTGSGGKGPGSGGKERMAVEEREDSQRERSSPMGSAVIDLHR